MMIGSATILALTTCRQSMPAVGSSLRLPQTVKNVARAKVPAMNARIQSPLNGE